MITKQKRKEEKFKMYYKHRHHEFRIRQSDNNIFTKITSTISNLFLI